MTAIKNEPTLFFLCSRDLLKVEVDEDIRHITESDLVRLTVYLDFVQFLSKGHSLSFLKNDRRNGNDIMSFKKQTCTKPPMGLKDNKTNGHYYHLGTIRGKYEIHLAFSTISDLQCDCSILNQELHVHPSVIEIISQAVHTFLSLHASALTGYYESHQNHYDNGQTFNVPLRDLLKEGIAFPILTGHSFFENHEMSFLVTCIGQNDEVGQENEVGQEVCADLIMDEISATFNADSIQKMRMSLAYSVSVQDSAGSPLSVVIQKDAFDSVFLNGLTEAKFFTKCFSGSFSNFQAKKFPIALKEQLSAYTNIHNNASLKGEKLNFYNGN